MGGNKIEADVGKEGKQKTTQAKKKREPGREEEQRR